MSSTDHLSLWSISTRTPTQSNHQTLMSSSVAEWPCHPTNSQSMTTRVLVRSPPTTRCHDIPFIPTVLLLQRRNACTHCVPLTFAFDLFTHHAFQASLNSVLHVITRKKLHFGSRAVHVDLIPLSRGNLICITADRSLPSSAQITDHDLSF